MTRRSGYRIYACPSCGHENLAAAYGCVNFSLPVPPDVFADSLVCMGCGVRYQVAHAIFRGWLNTREGPPSGSSPDTPEIPEFLRRKVDGS